MNQPTKRAVIVTGGSRGIGAEIVRLLAARDIPVCFNYVTRPDEANALAQELNKKGHRFCMVQADVADPESVKRMFEQADQRLGQLGGLVNNAGFVGIAGRRIDTLDIETLRKTFNVNVIGPIVCAQEALKRLSTKHGRPGGRIINVSSIAARTGSPNDWVDYAASKAALDTFTLGLAREVAKEGIQVTGVAPGGVSTTLHAIAGAPERIERMAKIIPMGRAAYPKEIADVVVWALLDAPEYLTGTTIDVAGGL
jgi:NAD(P)-dependent dehydrogenase (short-subunit alcohol dehydrogenase family)